MHRIQTTKWRAIFAAACVLAILFGGLIAQSVRAVSPNPAPVCVGSNCSVTFSYTGDYYQWSPPAGAQNVAIDLLGAQGGRSGGLGGRVTGSFVTVPTSLYIYVGGAGNQGSGAVGGYNGGGAAGSGRGDEGSGGGATDIRTGTLLADRIAVAGGGGGSGGFSGGGGGGAGGVSGSAGTSGQGQGGSGATATAGGSGGFPNGGSWGSLVNLDSVVSVVRAPHRVAAVVAEAITAAEAAVLTSTVVAPTQVAVAVVRHGSTQQLYRAQPTPAHIVLARVWPSSVM